MATQYPPSHPTLEMLHGQLAAMIEHWTAEAVLHLSIGSLH